MSHMKLLGIVALVSALALGSWLLWDDLSYSAMSPEQRLQALWEQDVPKGFQSLKSIQLIGADDRAKSWIPHLKAPLKTTPNGKYKLEVLLISWVHEKALGAIVQYDLYEVKSGNLEEELGRTFVLDEDYKGTPPHKK